MHTLAGASDFPTTRWTLVIAAADPQRKEARSALVSLCEGYWYPLYAYVRRRGYPADQAQDLTQEFFVRVLEGRYLDRADPEKGRFRAFILTSLKFFLADEADRIARRNAAGERPVPRNLVRRRALSTRACAQRDAGADLRAALGAFSARQSRGQTPGRVRAAWTSGPFQSVEGLPSRSGRDAVCRAGSRNGHIRGSAQSRHPQAPQALSRPVPPGDCGDRGRSGGCGIRTPIPGGRADAEIVAAASTDRCCGIPDSGGARVRRPAGSTCRAVYG